MSLLRLLADLPMTATGLARQLDVHPANLTRHLRLLERTGLIRIVERRDTGRNLEKYYRASALAYEVRLRTDRVGDRRATILGILRDNLSTAVATARHSSTEVVGLLEQARLDRSDVPRLAERLNAVVREFAALDAPDGVTYNMSLALYPAEAASTEPGLGTMEI
jgi:DNA-binding transcriptional ArsR family regulator